VSAGGRTVTLTRREFDLLWTLAEHDGLVHERERLYERVWGYAMPRGDRSVDVFVRRLRRKLGDLSPGWDFIHTHVGVGYSFAAGAAPRDRALAA
jgi:DNA-binding response OmpR family regulator